MQTAAHKGLVPKQGRGKLVALLSTLPLLVVGLWLRFGDQHVLTGGLARIAGKQLSPSYTYMLQGLDSVPLLVGGAWLVVVLAGITLGARRLRRVVHTLFVARSATLVAVTLLVSTTLNLGLIYLIPYQPWSDFLAYHIMARDLLHGAGVIEGWGGRTGQPSAFWPVGYPALLTPFYAIFGPNYHVAQVLNVALKALLAVITYGIGKRMFAEPVARLGFLLIAFFPSLFLNALITGYDLLLSVIVALLAYGLLTTQRLTLRRSCVLGGLLAAGVYVRPVLLLFPLVIGLGFWLLSRRLWAAILHTAVVSSVMLLLIAPWSYRNYRVFHQFVLVNTNGGMNLLIGNHPATTGGYNPEVLNHYPEAYALPEPARDAYYQKLALGYMRSAPKQVVLHMLKKAVRLFGRDDQAVTFATQATYTQVSPQVLLLLAIMCNLYYYAVVCLAAWFIATRAWRWQLSKPAVILVICIGYLTGVHLVFIAMDHYHVPLLFAFSLFAAGTLQRSDHWTHHPS